MKQLLFLLILGVAGAGLYLYFREQDEPGSEREVDPDSRREMEPLPPPRPGRRVEVVINDYFQRLEEDIAQFEISTFFSYQFDLESLKKPYVQNVGVISSLSELGLNDAEVEAGKRILIEKASEVIPGRQPDWSTSLSFLKDYSGAKAKLSALERIYDQVDDRAKADKYRERLQAAKAAVVARYR